MKNTKRKTIILTSTAVVLAALLIANPAISQTVETQDISLQLQSSLEESTSTTVFFDFDKDTLTQEALIILNEQAVWLQSNPEAKVDLAGHTDAVGTDDYNFDLALRRARAVENYLLQSGVRAAQMRSVVSQGEKDLAIATTKRERQNRRVRTSVTGLVEIVAALPPSAPPPPVLAPPASRTYAEGRPPLCDGRSRTSLLAMTDTNQIRSALETNLNKAITVYSSQSAISSTTPTYNLAAFTKSECGIAIGYTKKSIKDERSILNCECYTDLL